MKARRNIMKQLTELNKNELTVEQKLGLLLCANLNHGDADVENALEMIRDHKLGSVWISHVHPKRDELIARVREVADYPIIIMCDAEQGYAPYNIPGVISLTAAGANEEYAHSFGRLNATIIANEGYNLVCSPVLDGCLASAPCGGTTRNFGPDRKIAAKLGAAMARGMHEGGVLACAKHYPSTLKKKPYDTHMREGYCEDTREELIENSLYPYRKLIEENLIDGVMVGHGRYINIDPERPASLSRTVLNILREECDFKGFYITDALNMMGVVLKYGNYITTPMAVQAGCDIPLSWGIPSKEAYQTLLDGYRDGIITDEQLDISLDRILETHHKITLLPQNTKILPEDVTNIGKINRECISSVCAEGYTPSIDPNGKHLFVIMTDGTVELDRAEYDAFSGKAYNPPHIAETIKSLFPNSGVVTHPDHPNYNQNMSFFKKQQLYDDIVYITYYASACFIGRECLTPRTIDMMDALQSTDRIIAHLHFGNPFVATDAPFVPRVLLGWISEGCIDHTLNILAGKAQCLGTQPYADYLKFHKKGDLLI